MTDEELISRLRLLNEVDANSAADRIEELVKEVERRIEPEQVEKLVMMADPIMSELYAIECSYRQEAEAKLSKAVEALRYMVNPEFDEFDGKLLIWKNEKQMRSKASTVLAELEATVK